MKHLVLTFLLALGAAGDAPAQPLGIEATIDAQIDAFKADDLDRAFTYASPAIRRIFRTPENFGAMVRRGYPMVWRPGSVDYLERSEAAGHVRQIVRVTGRDGAVHVLEYRMIEQENGWKINGVAILETSLPAV